MFSIVGIESTIIGRNTIEVALINGFRTLSIEQQCLVHLLTVKDADDLDIFFLSAKKLAQYLGRSLYDVSRSLLYKKTSPFCQFSNAKSTITASSRDIMKRVIGPSLCIWLIHNYIMLPREHITLPYLVQQILVPLKLPFPSYVLELQDFATAIFSSSALLLARTCVLLSRYRNNCLLETHIG